MSVYKKEPYMDTNSSTTLTETALLQVDLKPHHPLTCIQPPPENLWDKLKRLVRIAWLWLLHQVRDNTKEVFTVLLTIGALFVPPLVHFLVSSSTFMDWVTFIVGILAAVYQVMQKYRPKSKITYWLSRASALTKHPIVKKLLEMF